MTEMIFWNESQNDTSEQARWNWGVTGNRIPRTAGHDVERAAAILAQANAILDQAKAEADSIREQAYLEGIAQSDDCVAEVLSEALLVSQYKVADHLERMEPRVIQLVFMVLERLLPDLPIDRVMHSLVKELLNSIHQTNHVKVYVNPAIESNMRGMIPSWYTIIPGLEHIEVVGDADLALASCRVESTFGSISAGLQEKFDQLVKTYQLALNDRQEK